ncbi:MAG: hypothetical protein HQL15_00185 [Candidatus Omnitrophica bacterium]|nr:hypothetical protein [Candidatus Omnitrophota bacterium]
MLKYQILPNSFDKINIPKDILGGLDPKSLLGLRVDLNADRVDEYILRDVEYRWMWL